MKQEDEKRIGEGVSMADSQLPVTKSFLCVSVSLWLKKV